MKKAKLILLGIASAFAINASAQTIGSLDTSFNVTGKVTSDFNSGSDGATAVLIQHDGKIVTCGWAAIGTNYNFALTRYNTDGSLDTSFGGTGKVNQDFSGGYDQAQTLAIQIDDKIVVAGGVMHAGVEEMALMRFNTDGSLDTSFGIYGKVNTPAGTADAGISSLAILPDGRFVVCGISTTFGGGRDIVVARYTLNGSLDYTFGQNGMTITDVNAASYDFPFALKIQNDGKIVVGGASGIDPVYDFVVLRYDSLGTLDPTFGTNGITVTDFGKQDEWGNALALQTDGKIILAGVSGSPYKFALSRYLTDGSLDTTFNSTGKVLSAFTAHVEGNAIAIDTISGNIMVAGVSFVSSNRDFCVARYLPNGQADGAWGGAGFVTTSFNTVGDVARGVDIQSDGKVVVAGYTSNDFAVARYIIYMSTGLIDFTSMNNSLLIYPNPVTENATLNYELKLSEKITISLTDAQGRLVKTFIQNEMKTAGQHEQLISMNNLPKGNYFIVIANGSEHLSIQVVK